MTHQPTLFDTNPSGGFYDDIATRPLRPSRNAGKRNRNEVYESTLPRHAPDRERIADALRLIGDKGATRQELAALLKMPEPTVCGRVRELLDEDVPRVIETDQRRHTKSGSTAVVLRWAWVK